MQSIHMFRPKQLLFISLFSNQTARRIPFGHYNYLLIAQHYKFKNWRNFSIQTGLASKKYFYAKSFTR